MQIDEEILQEVVKMGFDRNHLVESLRSRVQNEVCTFGTHPLDFPTETYYLHHVSGNSCILFVIGQPFPCIQWLSWS